MNQPVAEASPRGRARIAGAFYLVNIVSGALAPRLRGRLGVASRNRLLPRCDISLLRHL